MVRQSRLLKKLPGPPVRRRWPKISRVQVVTTKLPTNMRLRATDCTDLIETVAFKVDGEHESSCKWWCLVQIYSRASGGRVKDIIRIDRPQWNETTTP